MKNKVNNLIAIDFKEDRETTIKIEDLNQEQLSTIVPLDAEEEEKKLKRREQAYLSKYNLTLEQYNQILKKQKNCCSICNTDNPGTPHNLFVVDHDHQTDMIRGLLCNSCNLLLGHGKDNIRTLLKAIEYLNKSLQYEVAGIKLLKKNPYKFKKISVKASINDKIVVDF